jgi:outer membrane lipoprotein SlyB
MKMKALVIGVVAIAGMAGQANAAGCLKGAAVGGVGGHFVGKGHAVAGAAGGCVVGHHMAAKKAKDDAAARAQAQPAQQTSH